MAVTTSGIEFDAPDYESLEAKMVEFSKTLTPAESAVLEQLLDHAMAHANEVTGFVFEAPEEDEVSGFAFGGPSGFAPQFKMIGQFGMVSGGYVNQFNFGAQNERF